MGLTEVRKDRRSILETWNRNLHLSTSCVFSSSKRQHKAKENDKRRPAGHLRQPARRIGLPTCGPLPLHRRQQPKVAHFVEHHEDTKMGVLPITVMTTITNS